jgi:hypothetical protein
MKGQRQTLLILAFTAIFIGYLTVWLPGPGAGLSFLGIEMAEWFKFSGLGARRDIFYLPPITLSLMLAVWTVTWSRQGWQAWLLRGFALLISLLAFPAIEDITGPVREQYTLRVWLIALVVVVALLSGFWHPTGKRKRLPWILLALLGLIGLLLPTWMYMQVRPFASQMMGVPIGVGLGVPLNGLGHLLVTIVSLLQVQTVNRYLPTAQGQKT